MMVFILLLPLIGRSIGHEQADGRSALYSNLGPAPEDALITPGTIPLDTDGNEVRFLLAQITA